MTPSLVATAFYHGLAILRVFIVILVVYFALSSFMWVVHEARNFWRRTNDQGRPARNTPRVVKIDPLPPMTGQPWVDISGTTNGSASVWVRVNEKVFGPYFISSEKRVIRNLPLARQLNRLSMEIAESGDRIHVGSIRYIASPLLIPKIISILELPPSVADDGQRSEPAPEPAFGQRTTGDMGGRALTRGDRSSRKLLVGQTDAGSTVTLFKRGSPADLPMDRVYADDHGIFGLEVDEGVLAERQSYVLSVSHNDVVEKRSVGFAEALRDAHHGAVSRSIEFHLAPEDLKVTLAVTGPAGLPYFRKLLAGEMSGEAFVGGVFGGISVPVTSQASAITNGGDGMTIRLEFDTPLKELQRTLAIDRAQVPGPGKWPLLTKNDTVTVTWDESQPAWFSPMPNVLERGKAVWKGPGNAIEIGLPQVRPIPERSISAPREPNSIQEQKRSPPALRELLKEMRLPRIGAVFATAVLLVLPFCWVLYALRTRPDFLAFDTVSPSNSRVGIAAATVVLGVLALRYPMEQLLSQSGRYLAQATPWLLTHESFLIFWVASLACVPYVVRYLGSRPTAWITVPLTGDIRTSLPGLIGRSIVGVILAALAVWLVRSSALEEVAAALPGLSILQIPLLEKSVAELQLSKTLQLLIESGALFVAAPLFIAVLAASGYGVLLSFLAVWLVVVFGRPLFILSPQVTEVFALQLTTLGVLILAFSILPVRRLWKPRILGGGAWRRFLGMVLLFVALLAWPSSKPALWAGGIITAWTYIWLCFYVAENVGAKFPPEDLRWKLTRYGIYLVAALFCYPEERISGSFHGVAYLLNDFYSVSKYVVLIAIVIWLRQCWKRQARTDDLDEWLGPALFAFFLIGNGYFLYVPVTLILGYLFARYWLFHPLPVSGSQQMEDRRKAVEELIERRWVVSMARSVRRTQDKKLQKGEITLAEHEKALEQFRAKEEKLARIIEQEGPASERALLRGPYESAWQNAITGVKYGLPLALGPVFLTAYRFAWQEWPSPYPTPAYLFRLLLELLFWLFIAFFFGYFYRRLRGTSGLGKGVWLAIAIIVPYVCLRLMAVESTEEMAPFFLWAGQVFAFCTVLGLLAFDYETLRACGFSWPQLTALHRTPTLSAFASSLLAAVGPVLITVYQGKAKDVVNIALKFIGHLFPDTGSGVGP